MAFHRTCDGIGRRDFLKVGAIGATGLTLSNYLRLAEAGDVSESAGAKAGIFINLNGGPSHMDTFDMKPDAPAEYRGTFNPTKTNVSGIEICEHLQLVPLSFKVRLLVSIEHGQECKKLALSFHEAFSLPHS